MQGVRLCSTSKHTSKATEVRYIPLEMAAIFFSSEPLSKTGYRLGVCHG